MCDISYSCYSRCLYGGEVEIMGALIEKEKAELRKACGVAHVSGKYTVAIDPYKDSNKVEDSPYLPKDYVAKVAAMNNIKKDETPSSQIEIARVCDKLKAFLIDKNKKYGNSALNPLHIFSKKNSVEQIYVRLDDKLSRISNRQDNEDEDVVWDTLGYLVLLVILLEEQGKKLEMM